MYRYKINQSQKRLQQECRRFLSEVRKRERLEKKTFKNKKQNQSKTLTKKVLEMPKVQRLPFLKKLSAGPVKFGNDYKKLRQKKNNTHGKPCVICGDKSECMHHIIPLSCGGDNKKGNLIPVCSKCHKQIHPFM